jgi:hypothetical protein
VYGRILEIISDPNRIPDSAFRADTYAHQAAWDDWGRGYAPPPARPGETKPPPVPVKERSNVLIMRMATRTEAIEALREVGGQGESAHLRVGESEEPSHFDRFRKLLHAFEHEGKHWNVVHDIPVNPTTIEPRDKPVDSTSIRQKTSLLWAKLFNLRYRALLMYLSHTFRLVRLVDTEKPNVRGAIMHKIFGEMYNIKTIAGILVRRPLNDLPSAEAASGRRRQSSEPAGEPQYAAPPFEMPYTLDLPMDEPDCWRCHQDTLNASLEIERALLTSEDPQGVQLTDNEQKYLRTLQQLDEKSTAWMENIRQGLLRTGGYQP